MRDCVFCDIVKRDKNNQILQIISTPIGSIDVIVIEPHNPCVDGHVLFIPDVHAESMISGHSLVSAALSYAVSKYSKHVDRCNQDYNMIVNNGAYAGQTVFHMHFHYIPRKSGDGLFLPWDKK